jgi:hypothetical protein
VLLLLFGLFGLFGLGRLVRLSLRANCTRFISGDVDL